MHWALGLLPRVNWLKRRHANGLLLGVDQGQQTSFCWVGQGDEELADLRMEEDDDEWTEEASAGMRAVGDETSSGIPAIVFYCAVGGG